MRKYLTPSSIANEAILRSRYNKKPILLIDNGEYQQDKINKNDVNIIFSHGLVSEILICNLINKVVPSSFLGLLNESVNDNVVFKPQNINKRVPNINYGKALISVDFDDTLPEEFWVDLK